MKGEVKEIVAKTMLHYHKNTTGANWDANIYRGCGHNCPYCFAQYSHQYLSDDIDFFTDVFVKSNADILLNNEFKKKKWDNSIVNLSGVSDCYQPIEKKYKMMPKVIKTFIKNKNPMLIISKSTLMLRDFDLIEELTKVAEVSIFVSVSTMDEKKRVLIEPNCAPTIERIKMLRKFKDIGCKTGVLFMPILPGISDDKKNLDKVFRTIKDYDLGAIVTALLSLRGKTKKVYYSFLRENYPELIPLYNFLYEKGLSKDYISNLNQKINSIRKKYNMYEVYEPTLPKVKKERHRKLFN